MSILNGTGTGYFHTERVDGVDWLVDPRGNRFLSFGVNHITWNGDPSPALGYAPYHRHVTAKYGTREEWMDAALGRVAAWGFNTIGTWSDPELHACGMPYVRILNIGVASGGEWRKGIFPDVFSDRFRAATLNAAEEQCAQLRDDPHLLGYFTDNELRWGPDIRTSRTLLADYWRLDAEASGKRDLIRFLQERYESIERFNQMWETQFPGFDALRYTTDIESVGEPMRAVRWESLMHTLLECCLPARIITYLRAWHDSVDSLNAYWGTAFDSFEAAVEAPPRTERGRERSKLESGFLRRVAERYFTGCREAIRSHDPNHMILGCRFAGSAFPEVVQSMGPHVDLVSYNNYSFEAPVERLHTLHEWTGKPIMLTEFSFKAMDSGLPNTHGAGVPVQTQQERADRYAKYTTALMKLPFAVGFHWFQYTDQPAEGRHDGENSNYGLVTIEDEPWETLTTRMQTINRELFRIHLDASL